MKRLLNRRRSQSDPIRPSRQRRICLEGLESRVLMSVNITTHHGDAFNDGANLAETVLTPANVNSTDFGKLFTTQLDGQMFAQPLYVQNVNITRGSSPGVHSVVYAATQHDSLYAIDANTGAILWQDSFLNIANPESLTPTTGVTTISATAIASTDVGPQLGILATPAIDTKAGQIFLNANTTEIRGSDTHYVQRLWAVSLSSGIAVNSTVIADTIYNSTNFTAYTGYQYVSGPIVDGTGNNMPTGATPTYPDNDGWISAPGGATGYVIAYNALEQMQRTAVSLINGNIYLASASHDDDGPYYGWILGYKESTLQLSAAFVTTPTYEGIVGDREDYTAQGGIWMSGSAISTDGSYLYLTTGNGAFNPAPSNFDANGFPIDHDYGDSLLKLAIDSSSTPTKQNGNGWGLKVADYFTPSNEAQLNVNDYDLGSTGVTLLPNNLLDKAGHPMLVIAGKESRIYLIDRNNLGKFNFKFPTTGTPDPRNYDRVLGEFGGVGSANAGNAVYGTAAYFNGEFYIANGTKSAVAFEVSTFASGTVPPGTTVSPTPFQSTTTNYGYPGSTFDVTANGATNGIVWAVRALGGPQDNLLAYTSTAFTAPIYDSDTDSSRDALTGGVTDATASRFSVPTIVNGMVYVGTGASRSFNNGALVGYGLLSTYLASNAAYFGAPSALAVTTPTSTDAHLTWTSHSSLATEFRIDHSTNGTTWSTLAYVSNSASSYDDTIASKSVYYYRVVAISGSHATAASNVVHTGTAAEKRIHSAKQKSDGIS